MTWRPLSRLWRRWDSRPWNCGPDISTAWSSPSARRSAHASGAVLRAAEVRLLSYGTKCRFQSRDSAERQQQVEIGKQFVDHARDTGALGIKLQPMGLPADVPQETAVGYFGASMRELGDYWASRGVEICM